MRLPAILLLLVTASPALAQEAGASDSDLDDRARVHFHAGRDYYERGDYENALRELGIAYEMSHRPELLYNLGACHERMGHLTEAADLYDQYLAAMTDVEGRVAIEERVARLRARAAAEAASAEAETSTGGGEGETTAAVAVETTDGAAASSTASTGGGPHPVAFVVLGAGAVGLATFGVLGGLALAEDATLASECGTACAPARASTLEALGLGADISLGIGAALAITGVVLLFTTTDGGSEPATTVGIGPGGVSVAGRF